METLTSIPLAWRRRLRPVDEEHLSGEDMAERV